MVYDHCFCYVVYGRNEKYWKSLQLNLLQIQKLNCATCVIFTDDLEYMKQRLSGSEECRIIEIPEHFSTVPRVARFMAANIVCAKYYHFRDSDSLITQLELVVAEMQLNQGHQGIIIRNHPLHFAPILAGLFSLDYKLAKKLSTLCEVTSMNNGKYYDQVFLSKYFYSSHMDKFHVFTSNYRYFGEKFSVIRCYKDFAGKPVDFVEDNNPDQFSKIIYSLYYHRMLSRLLQSPRFIVFYRKLFYVIHHSSNL